MMKLTNANTKTQIICNTIFLGKFSRNFPNGQEIMDRLILWHAMLSLFKVATITQTSSNYQLPKKAKLFEVGSKIVIKFYGL